MAEDRKTVHLTKERHDELHKACYEDGRVNLNAFVDEAVAHYMSLSPASRLKWRRKLAKERAGQTE